MIVQMVSIRYIFISFWILNSNCQDDFSDSSSDSESEEIELRANTSLFEYRGYPNPGDIPLLNRKIFRGERVTIREHPYIVSIRRHQAHYLTGTLVSKNLVISVAHPIYNVPTYDLEIVAGENYSDRGTKLLTVILVLIHNEFDPYTLLGDIALIRFYEDIVYRSHMKSIALLAPSANLTGHGIVSGWGRCDFTGRELCLPRTNKYFLSEKVDPMLRSVSVELTLPNYYCSGYELNGTPLQRGMVCFGTAREENAVTPCLAVPGAPLVIKAKLAGLLSWGFGCGYINDLPLVYTEIRYYTPWLLHNIPILRNIKSENISALFVATKSYILMQWLNSTRLFPPSGHKHMNKPLEQTHIDRVLAGLDGQLFDLRDFIFDKKHRQAKSEMYEYILKSIGIVNSTNEIQELSKKKYITKLSNLVNNKTMSINFSDSDSSDEQT